MPVTSALHALAANGLVVNRERVGFFVRVYTEKELRQILEERKMYEIHSLTAYFDGIDLTRAENLLALFSRNTDRKVLEGLDIDFHKMIVRASANDFLISEYERMSALFSVAIYGGHHTNTNLANQEHTAILQAILKRDPLESVSLLSAHLDRAREEICEIYGKQ